MSKLPKSAVVCRLDPYKHSVVLVTRRKDYPKLCKHYEPLGTEAGITNECGCNGLIFHIGVFDGKVSTLAHEAAHVVFALFRHIGMPANAQHSEAFCYLLEHIVGTFVPAVMGAADAD